MLRRGPGNQAALHPLRKAGQVLPGAVAQGLAAFAGQALPAVEHFLEPDPRGMGVLAGHLGLGLEVAGQGVLRMILRREAARSEQQGSITRSSTAV
jgi:hypothetical protein